MGSENAVHTGYFNDGIRRIDMVLVLVDDGDAKTDEIKTTYFLNILKVGLEVEAENGVMKCHERYIFVKVHAPDGVLQLYGDVFNIRKHFKDNHVEFINAGNMYMKVLSIILPFLYENREKEWIKIVRKQYPGPGNFSTLERSQIVYRMLLVLPFGSNENYVGLERLLQNNIILDAYALHDGPYFFLPKQDIANKVNARQILYNYWMGADMIIKDQPLSLLQEYFGEKIAFYFAYSELFNRALIIAAAAGVVMTYLAYEEATAPWRLFLRRGLEPIFCDTSIARSTHLCPRCRDFDLCPFYDAYSACNEVLLSILLETPNMVHFNIFIIIWGTIFVIFWRRREYYLSWLWELDTNGSYIPRLGYKINVKSIRRSKVTGILRSYESVGRKILLIFEAIFILCLFLAVVFPMTIFWAHFQFIVLKEARVRHLPYPYFSGLIIFSSIYGMANTVLEKVIQILSYLAIRIENHKTQNNYEKSLIVKQFGATLIFNFAFFFFLAFIKGRLYTYPYDIENWQTIAGIGMMNCGIFTCMVEVSALLAVHIILKVVVLKGIPALLRYNSWYLLLGSRRPLLHNSVGIANWRNIIFMLAMLSALVNVLMMVFNTRAMKADFYEPFGFYYNTPWHSFFCTNVSTTEYLTKAGPPGDAFKAYTGNKPANCLYFGIYGTYKKRFTQTNKHWDCRREHFRMLVLSQHLVILLVIAIILAIPMYPKDIEETLAIEKRIISQCFVRHQLRGLH